jgi:chaperonin GroES
VAKSKKPVAKKKAAVKKVVLKKSAAKKVSAKKAAPKKTVAKKAALKKPAPKKAAPKKTITKKSAPQKATAVKTTPAKAFVTNTAKKSVKKVDLSNFLTPLDDRVIVQVAEAEKMTAGGLYIPDTVVDVSGNLQGFVVSVGRGHRNKKGHVRPMDLNVGDKILFSEYSGSKIKIQDQDLLIIREGDVLGVIA